MQSGYRKRLTFGMQQSSIDASVRLESVHFRSTLAWSNQRLQETHGGCGLSVRQSFIN
jgi:hypothetical protein